VQPSSLKRYRARLPPGRRRLRRGNLAGKKAQIRQRSERPSPISRYRARRRDTR
jgi:hypothetical protein